MYARDRGLGCVLSVAALLVSASAVAGDAARADALFKEGRAALEQGQLARACPLLKASFDEDPAAIGTLLNLAYCHEAQGHRWQAYREYDQAVRMATTAERKEFASRSRAGVARKLPHVRLQLGSQPVTEVVLDDGFQVTDPTQPFPVEPGRRTVTLVGPSTRRAIAIEAPNRAGLVAVIVVPEDGERLERVEPVPPPAPAEPSRSPDLSTPSPRASLVPYAIVSGGIGVAGIALGSYFGLKSLAIRDSACPTTDCDAAGLDRIHGSATTTATLSTIAFGVGAAGALGAFVLFVLDGSRPRAAVGGRAVAGGGLLTVDAPF